MKQHLRRLTACVLAVLLLSGTALASNALGDELHGYRIPLAEGATLDTQLFWSNSKSDLRTENYISYKPHSSLSPKVSYGGSILSKRTVAAMAADLEAQGTRVLSGINGDYFVMATGDPLGIVLTDGILRSSASHLDAVGFLADGSAIIGKPDLTVTARFPEVALKIAEVNKVRSDAGYFLYSSDFAATTQNTKPGIDLVLAPVKDQLGETVTADNGQSLVRSDVLKIGGRVSCVVEEVIDATAATPIPPGKFVLTINKNSDPYLVETLTAIPVGATIDLDITATDPRWNNVDCAIGGMYRILSDGAVNTGLDDAAAPRTAVGVKPDGSVIFYTIDGRQTGLSVGASMTQVANRLLELGCVNAVCLDGGGSTTLGVTDPGSNGFEISNSPSEGGLRAVSNALFLVSNLPPSGTPASLFIEPESRVFLSGGSAATVTSLVDSNWHPLDGAEVLSYSAEKGSVSEQGLYTAPATGGVDTITVRSAAGLSGSTTVTVFSTPTSISLRNEETGKQISSVNLAAKESVNLRASAVYNKVSLTAQDESFQWSVSPENLASITPDGVFTAGTLNGTGSINITAGEHKASIPFTIAVQSKDRLLDGFEGDSLLNDGEGMTLSLENTGTMVRFGENSLRADYQLVNGSAQLSTSFPLVEQDQFLSLWVYGDKSGNQLSATIRDSAEATHSLPLGVLDFSGWKRLSVALPADSAHFTGLSLSGSTTSGILWMDQLLCSNQQEPDNIAPTLALTLNGTKLSATVSDNNTAPFEERQFSLLLDGKPLDFSFDGATLSAQLPALSGSLQRLSLTVTDPAGNLARASKTLGSSEGAGGSFVDMKGHWAASYTDYLAARGIVKGEIGSKGNYFYPDRSITRGDFALMTARWMGLDLDQYADVALPFVDTAAIPAWSQNAVKAMYTLGIMQGTTENNVLYARASAPITRAEAMTILGRIQPKGYSEASLSAFTDAASIPAWSKAHLASLVGQGVVGGFEGKLRPTDSVSRAELCKMLFTLW